ncbi:poly(U)-specific endoribonuclease homolog [Coccinella septempunctata]|uniref:poly(U)-specific endoribonuclease homolog n=1 Tax=Coccinella septempunctata TaxID=41139 RepID=UPI001D061FCF|nr:poly(U)-specific endoribonuclease homolog [Coccinella septempunctata]
MSPLWSVLSSCLLVFILLFSEYLCEDDLFGIPIQPVNINNHGTPISNRSNSNVHTQTRTHTTASSLLNNKEWPAIGERRNYNHNNHPTSTQASFVRQQVDIWNARLSPNTSYSSSVDNRANTNIRPQQSSLRTTGRPSTGIQFSDDRKNGAEGNTAGKSEVPSVTDNELREFSEKLLLKDNNNAARYVKINYQGRTTSRSKNDEAPLPLLSISREAYSIPTISKLLPLYDNYIVQSNVNEDYTNQEKQEENALLRAILNTDVMRETRKFLMDRGAITGNEREFEKLLYEMWFNLYPRAKNKLGSSGFEHVFLGELKKGDVSGLHNWLYFEREESSRRANYLGYLKKIDLGDKGAIIKFNFDFHGVNKPVGSMFIGTSPELEMALYSTCFILRADRVCPLKLGGKRLVIRTYTLAYNGKKLIGSAFPEI